MFLNKSHQSNKNFSSDKQQVKNNLNDSNNNSKENKSYKNIKCTYCHKIGHLARNRWKQKTDIPRNKMAKRSV